MTGLETTSDKGRRPVYRRGMDSFHRRRRGKTASGRCKKSLYVKRNYGGFMRYKSAYKGFDWGKITLRIFEVYGNPLKAHLAKELGISPTLVTQWTTENLRSWRHPTIEHLRKIVETKGVTWDWLLEGQWPKHRCSGGKAERPRATKTQNANGETNNMSIRRRTTKKESAH